MVLTEYTARPHLAFRLERRIRLPGQDWGDWRLEAECRHFADVAAMAERREDRVQECDETGRLIQAEYRIASSATGDTLKSFIIGV